MAVQTYRRYALITELNEEWARLVARHRDQLPWDGATAGCRDLAEVIAAIRYRPDPVLGALIRETAAGDLLAGRTVLQAMLGKAVRLAQAYPDVEVDEFVSALWCRIRTYPLARRPTKIAANLALDTRKDVLAAFRGARQELAAGSLSGPSWERLMRQLTERELQPEAADIQAHQVIDMAEARGLIDPATSSALRSVYLDGASSRAAAARLGTSPGMIRYRCSRGLRELSRHAAVLSEAA